MSANKLAILLLLFASPAAAKIHLIRFSGTITNANFNFVEQTQSGPFILGDTVRGSFLFDDSVLRFSSGTVGGRRAGGSRNTISATELVFQRNRQTTVSFIQTARYFANGNRADESSASVEDNDSLRRRDSLRVSVQGGDAFSGSVLSMSPDRFGLRYGGFGMLFREACSSGSIATSDCNSFTPATDFYDGSQTTVPLLRAIQSSGVREGSIALLLTSGDVVDTRFSLDTLAVVPEPTTWAFLIIGFGLIGAAMRRSKFAVASLVAASHPSGLPN
jgi:hypothetical protein